jgi:hypothetical protein
MSRPAQAKITDGPISYATLKVFPRLRVVPELSESSEKTLRIKGYVIRRKIKLGTSEPSCRSSSLGILASVSEKL